MKDEPNNASLLEKTAVKIEAVESGKLVFIST